jgi:polar amino acid transport system substrate-binding protein
VTSSAAVSDLAPTGRLRAAINFGNPVLAGKDPVTGAPCGISVDLAHELARRLGVPIEIVPYDGAGKVVAGIAQKAWDVCFLAIDPLRAEEISFTAAYAVIEGVYLVAAKSSIQDLASVDRPGIRVGVIKGSAYDLHLSREVKHASIVRAEDAGAVMDLWVAGQLDVVAGVKAQLEADAKRIPGLRMLPGSFMAINQAMGTLRGRDAGSAYLRQFVDDVKTGGFVAGAFARNHITGAIIAK